MCSNSRIIRERQSAIRRELDRRNVSLKVVSLDTSIPYPTLATYFPADSTKEPAQIPGGAIFSLCGVLPDDLMSLLLPDGFQVLKAPEGVCLDTLAVKAHSFLHTKTEAHHPDSEAGTDIGPNERAELNAKAAGLAVVV